MATPSVGQNQMPGEPSPQISGDASHPPGTAELTGFLRSHLPPVIKLVGLKNDPPVPMPNTAPGSNAWLYNVRLTLAPTEDELGAPPPQQAQAFQDMVDELTGLAAWSQAYAHSPYASLYPGFTADPPTPASPQLLVVTRHKDRPAAPIYGKMAAEWQVDHWLYSVVDMALPEEDSGRFRSAYPGPVLIQGEPAAERFIAASKAAIAAAKPKYLSKDQVPAEKLAEEREIVKTRTMADPKNTGKPAEILDKIIEGGVGTFYKDSVLLEQPYIREPKQTVAQLVKGKAEIKRFVRFEIGEAS